jgi:hypothetical protein
VKLNERELFEEIQNAENILHQDKNILNDELERWN